MKIVFVLPKFSRYPIGGYKMVYEYAERISKCGNSVAVIHLNDDLMKKYHLPERIRRRVSDIVTSIGPTWIECGDITVQSVYEPFDREAFANANVVIATAIETVRFVQEYFECRKVYFIQGFENWNVTNEELFSTYSNDMKKIVVSKWLKETVDRYSPVESTLINNPIDLEKYKIRIPFSKRDRYTVAVMYNEQPVKGFKYSLEAIMRLKEKYPQLVVNMFGRKTYPEKLPNWIRYTKNASQDDTIRIYNNSRVFLCSAIEEGFGLTGLESMACGCILVSTDCSGVREYAENGYNALLSPIKNVDELVSNLEVALSSDEVGLELVSNGEKTAGLFSWGNALHSFMKAIED